MKSITIMGKIQIIVLLAVVTCAIISTVQSVPVSDSSVESENAAKCKKLCGFCDCAGYYCGDECLCECNSLTDGKAECVDTMKNNCKKLELPFEVLIQGPNVNRMVRSLLYANPDEETCNQSSEPMQKKRSTISIYKPDVNEQQDEILVAPKVETHEGDSPIHIIVGQQFDTKVDAVKEEMVAQIIENAENPVPEMDSSKFPLPEDVSDRTNIKRHIIDVNQDISEFSKRSDSDDSFLYKRDADGDEKPEDDPPTDDENVGAALPITAPTTPAPLRPKWREAIDNMKVQIPTNAELRSGLEKVRQDFDDKINALIANAESKAAELRSKITPPTPPTSPTPISKFSGPFLRADNEDTQVGTSLTPARPLLPLIPGVLPIQAELAKNMAANRRATEMAKNIATFRIDTKRKEAHARADASQLIKNLSKNQWFTDPRWVRQFFF